MAVSQEYRDFVLEQLGRVARVTARAMFGGVGIYADGLFFALIANDVLYFKVDDRNRGDFEAVGMGPFSPWEGQVMQYYEVPPDVLEDVDELSAWTESALDVARRAKRRRG